MYFPLQQPCLPAADRTESLLDHRGGASNTAGAQVDNIVGKFLFGLPRDSSVELGMASVSGHQSFRGKLAPNMDKGRKLIVYPQANVNLGNGCQKKGGRINWIQICGYHFLSNSLSRILIHIILAKTEPGGETNFLSSYSIVFHSI